jgi:hypothetical protein
MSPFLLDQSFQVGICPSRVDGIDVHATQFTLLSAGNRQTYLPPLTNATGHEEWIPINPPSEETLMMETPPESLVVWHLGFVQRKVLVRLTLSIRSKLDFGLSQTGRIPHIPASAAKPSVIAFPILHPAPSSMVTSSCRRTEPSFT